MIGESGVSSDWGFGLIVWPGLLLGSDIFALVIVLIIFILVNSEKNLGFTGLILESFGFDTN